MEQKKAQKVLMLRYELKERKKTEDKLRIYNFDEVNKEQDKELLTALATYNTKTTSPGEELK